MAKISIILHTITGGMHESNASVPHIRQGENVDVKGSKMIKNQNYSPRPPLVQSAEVVDVTTADAAHLLPYLNPWLFMATTVMIQGVNDRQAVEGFLC